jgi:AraC-like DNA-binding protein
MQADAPIPLVRAAIVIPILRQMAGCQLDVGGVLAGGRISLRSLDRPEGLIPLRQAVRLVADGARSAGMSDFGLVAGLNASFPSLGMLGTLILAGGTLEDALGAVFQFVPSFDSGGRWWLVREGERAHLCHRFAGEFDVSLHQADRFCAGLAVNLIRSVAGIGWTPERLELETPAEQDRLVPFASLEGTQVCFDRPAMAVTFPAAFLRRRLPSAVRSVAYDDVDGWLNSAPADDFVQSFQQVALATARGRGHPRIEGAACALGISVRTLQRRLMRLGSNFDGLMQRGRLEMAESLLRDTGARVLDIALDLGYSDHAHFSRAFRRWTGLSPRAYRRANRLQARSEAQGRPV